MRAAVALANLKACADGDRPARSLRDERIWAIKYLLFDYVKSPSLRHIRDPHSVTKLAQEIVKRIDRGNAIWGKWDGQREVVLKSAVACWIPIEDMRDFLNRMPGPPLTITDVAQRLKAFEEEEAIIRTKTFVPVAWRCTKKRKLKARSFQRSSVYSGTIWIRKKSGHAPSARNDIKQLGDQERTAQEQRLLSGADCR